MGNRYSPTVVVGAVSAQVQKGRMPAHVELPSEAVGLERDSVVLLEQIRTVDKRRLRERVSRVGEEIMARVVGPLAGLRRRPGPGRRPAADPSSRGARHRPSHSPAGAASGGGAGPEAVDEALGQAAGAALEGADGLVLSGASTSIHGSSARSRFPVSGGLSRTGTSGRWLSSGRP